MKNHVPTLETCQKLKEAGFPQHCTFKWIDPLSRPGTWVLRTDFNMLTDGSIRPLRPQCAAPILTEILDQLKPYAHLDEWDNGWSGFDLSVFWDVIDTDWTLRIANSERQLEEPMSCPQESRDNIVEAAALLWLELNPK